MNWIRLGTILALFLGSIYVLMPTILQEDLETRVAAQASEVDAPSAGAKVDFDLRFTVAGADASGAAEALRARLLTAGVPISRVEVVEGQVDVRVDIGGDREDVKRLAARKGDAAVYDARAVTGVDAAPAANEGAELSPGVAGVLGAAAVDTKKWSQALKGLGLAEVITTEAPLGVAVTGTSTDDSGAVSVALDGALPDGVTLALVAIDGRWVGLMGGDGTLAWLGAREGSGFRFDDDALAILSSGSLGASLTYVDEGAVADTEQVAEADQAQSRVPTWLLGLLPNTRMNLGLDLQGGIDLTLQVGLEDAVLAQATRDITYFKSQAAKEGLEIDQVRRDRFEPVVWITTDAELSDLQTFNRKWLSDYVYTTSDGNSHAFEMTDRRQADVKSQAVEQVLETLRKRVDATGVKEPSIVKKGGGRINVQLPGEVDLQAAVDAIGTTAVLEFRLVDEEFDDAVLDQIVQAAQDNMPALQYNDDALLNDWLWTTKRLDEDRIVLWEYEDTTDGAVRRIPYPLKNTVMLTGNDVNDAGVAWDQNQQAYVSLDFKPRGGQVFCDVTGANVGKRFGIILDGIVSSAPNIRERICGGSARIDMGATADPLKEAQTLALVLRTGSLDAPVDLGGVRTVGATLGQDSIRQGSEAAAVGLIVVVFFMVAWYGRSGLIANVALGLNLLMVLGALGLFGATLTLPGIAGIALTAGMAVDANIIIFERIREELRLGVHPRKAVDVGFDKGLVAVLDANITTAIAGIVLFSYGTGPIKGFAVTLLIGIVTTLITALFVTRTFMELSTRSSTARLRI